MTLQELRELLRAIEPQSAHPLDVGKSHGEADALLLDYIDDQQVTRAYKTITHFPG